jgi:glycine dehydrogenase subunit 1
MRESDWSSDVCSSDLVKIASPDAFTFKEFVVNFDGTGKSVELINKGLLPYRIFGGRDISKEFPVFGQSALYCVTEMQTKEDIDKLAAALAEICGA